ncbi:DUF2336 domain-containing protein [Parvibaculaceae bacterium PLY_AMNH_Bact1]|nr:DUF2336 domain-containing protein [Parvibaculaceae bacterium PLY_AMNH_Bact1]
MSATPKPSDALGAAAASLMGAEAQGHDQLIRRLADFLLAGGSQMAPNELALAETALIDLLPFADVEFKRRLAERVSPLESAPNALLSALLAEPFEVCEPILAEGLCLTNCDLVRVAEEADIEHRLCIARRLELSRVVCDALVTRGEPEVLSCLIANKGAMLSIRTLEAMVRRSSAKPELIRPLLQRYELTPMLAHLMFFWSDGEERALILKRFPVDRRSIVEALADAVDIADLLQSSDPALHETYRLLRRAERISEGAQLRLIAGVAEEAAQGALATSAGISSTTAAWIIGDPGGEPLAIAGKAMGLSREAFQQVAMALSTARPGGALSENEMERTIALFDSVTMDRADSILHFWDRIIASETFA